MTARKPTSLSDILGREDNKSDKVEEKSETKTAAGLPEFVEPKQENEYHQYDPREKSDPEPVETFDSQVEEDNKSNEEKVSTPVSQSVEDANKNQDRNTVVGLTNKDSVVKDDADTNKTSGLSNSVVHNTDTSKTPDELATETPDETASRYDITDKVNEGDVDNPRVQIYADTVVKQVPSGTHLHPDIAKDLHNYGIAARTTDSAQVKRTITETHDFAPDAETNDKF
jgi:hypothetical protein